MSRYLGDPFGMYKVEQGLGEFEDYFISEEEELLREFTHKMTERLKQNIKENIRLEYNTTKGKYEDLKGAFDKQGKQVRDLQKQVKDLEEKLNNITLDDLVNTNPHTIYKVREKLQRVKQHYTLPSGRRDFEWVTVGKQYYIKDYKVSTINYKGLETRWEYSHETDYWDMEHKIMRLEDNQTLYDTVEQAMKVEDVYPIFTNLEAAMEYILIMNDKHMVDLDE